jgi:hypothetical protein
MVVNLHLLDACNFRCTFCFARFNAKKTLSCDLWKTILEQRAWKRPYGLGCPYRGMQRGLIVSSEGGGGVCSRKGKKVLTQWMRGGIVEFAALENRENPENCQGGMRKL